MDTTGEGAAVTPARRLAPVTVCVLLASVLGWWLFARLERTVLKEI